MQYAALNQSKVNQTLMKIGGAGAIASGVLFIAGLVLRSVADPTGLSFGGQVDLIARLGWIAEHGSFNAMIRIINLFAWAALIPAVPALCEVAKDRSRALTPVGTFAGAVGVVLGLIGGLVLLAGEMVLVQAEVDTAVILVNIQLIDLSSALLRQSGYYLLVIWLALNGLVNVRLGKASRHWLNFGWYSLSLAGLWVLVINLELVAVVLLAVNAIWLGASLLRTR